MPRRGKFRLMHAGPYGQPFALPRLVAQLCAVEHHIAAKQVVRAVHRKGSLEHTEYRIGFPLAVHGAEHLVHIRGVKQMMKGEIRIAGTDEIIALDRFPAFQQRTLHPVIFHHQARNRCPGADPAAERFQALPHAQRHSPRTAARRAAVSAEEIAVHHRERVAAHHCGAEIRNHRPQQRVPETVFHIGRIHTTVLAEQAKRLPHLDRHFEAIRRAHQFGRFFRRYLNAARCKRIVQQFIDRITILRGQRVQLTPGARFIRP